jgi:hypothetical protein
MPEARLSFLGSLHNKKAAPLLAGRRFTAAINLNFHYAFTIAKYGLEPLV